ncbi:MAG: hypothetical protein K2J77_02255 [Oscillospiraceae bacterium]|nr:hypothetical protein [Oscillospiraceae bacterium]
MLVTLVSLDDVTEETTDEGVELSLNVVLVLPLTDELEELFDDVSEEYEELSDEPSPLTASFSAQPVKAAAEVRT